MILVASVETSEHAFQQVVVFAEQMQVAGYDPVLDVHNLSPDTRMATRFHAHPYLRDVTEIDLSHVIVIGAEAKDPDGLDRLRRLKLNDDAQVFAFGSFDTAQDEIAALNRLSYVLGKPPTVLALNDMPLIKAGTSICPSFGVDIKTETFPHLRGKPAVTLVVHDLEASNLANGLQFLTTSRNLTTLAYMSGKDKTDWMRMFPPGGHIYGFSEISPTTLSRMSDILVLTGPIGNNQNALCLMNNHLVSGGAVIDATLDAAFERLGLPVHRGPTDMAYLQPFLNETILPNLEGIKEAAGTAGSNAQLWMGQVFQDLPLGKKEKAQKSKPARDVHIMPTNGIGLGHAQRCVLIAEELAKDNIDPSFFAFPSCLPMINNAGFEGTPLVPRSGLHKDAAANDLANYARLHAQMKEGDVFVFDGGYIFDSVTRSITDHKLASVWVRRGLWKAAQDNRMPLDREKFFARVIVPQEALPELNNTLSSGAHIHHVGPTVRQVKATKKSKETLFASLKKEFSLDFERLVITMLGSGVVHDLSANVQSVCANIEQRDDCLNLIVNWPGAFVPASRYAWTRSKVVTSTHASFLAAHSELLISACGYNSFHEALYNRIPTIFVPQVAPSTDDQEARAEAAATKGLAAHVPAGKLSQLDREMRRFLDEGKAQEIRNALSDYQFAEPGNKKAADLIREMMV